MELVTAEQMRAIEHEAIDRGAVTGLELMERAGRGTLEAIFEEWPDFAPVEGEDVAPENDPKRPPKTALVLCGPGNNGGDGFVVARLLHDLDWQVEVLFWGDATRLPPGARANHDAWATRGTVSELTVEAAKTGPRPTLMIDALLGIGANRPLPREIALAHAAVEDRDVGGTHPWLKTYRIVALDCPSGMDSDSGFFLTPNPPVEADPEDDTAGERAWHWWSEDASKRLLRAHLVVAFHRLKPAHVLRDPLFKTRTVDIGLAVQDTHPAHLLMPRDPSVAHLLDADFGKNKRRARMWPGSVFAKKKGHKFEFGHALVLTGGSGRTGAARLAARGALRIGAGLVTLGVPGAAQLEVAGQITALMLQRVDDADGFEAVLEDPRISALCLGPGLGLERARALVPAALRSGRRCVLDADALTAFEETPDVLFQDLSETCVLTPHAGEFKRLFPDIADRMNALPSKGPAYSKIDAVRDAAQRAGCVVLLKGADTVIAHPDGRCAVHAAIHDRAVPWLATAGAGDVLAGFITGLLARVIPNEIDILPAVEVATWLHAECARSFGPGLIAEDLPEELPKVLASCL